MKRCKSAYPQDAISDLAGAAARSLVISLSLLAQVSQDEALLALSHAVRQDGLALQHRADRLRAADPVRPP